MGYGAPHAAVPPRTRPVSPSRAPGFRRRLRGSKPPYASGYSPRLTRFPIVSRRHAGSGDAGREVPPLDRGTCRLPPSLRPGRTHALSPYEVPELGVLQARPGLHGPQAGGSEQRGSRTPPVTGLAIVRPRLSGAGLPSRFPWSAGPPVSLSPLVPRGTLSTGLLRTRDGAMGSPHPVARTFTGFPAVSPGGFDPPGPFPGRPISPPIPRGMWIAVEPGAVPPTRRVECGASQDFPPAPRFPGFPPWGGGPKGYLSGPGTTRVRVRPHSRATLRPRSSGSPKGTLLRARERPGTREIKGILFTIPRPPRYPTPQRRPPCPPCPAWRSA